MAGTLYIVAMCVPADTWNAHLAGPWASELPPTDDAGGIPAQSSKSGTVDQKMPLLMPHSILQLNTAVLVIGASPIYT